MKTDMYALLAAALLTGCTNRQFDQWDRNHDGILERAEVPKEYAAHFDGADLNDDGVISRDEFRQTGEFLSDSKLFGRLEIIHDIPYADTTNALQRLDLYLPKDRKGTLPLLVYIHGGAWKQGTKSRALLMLRPYMRDGKYICATLAYRLSNEAIWPAQIHDCKAAIRWLRANAAKYNIDPYRIAVMGNSAGSHLAAMMGVSGGVPELEGSLGRYTHVSSRVSCAVDFSGPTDLLAFSQATNLASEVGTANSPESRLLGGIASTRPEIARSASPVAYVTSNAPPFLIAHGTRDNIVPIQQSELFYERLSAAKPAVPPVFIKMIGYGHGLFNADLAQRTRDFLDKHLYGKDVEISPAPIGQ